MTIWRSCMAIEVSRRQLLASAGGMVLASFALPPSLRKAIENVPASLARQTVDAADLRDQARRGADAGEPLLRPLLRRHARRARLRRPFGDRGRLLPGGPGQPGRVPAAVPRRHPSTSAQALPSTSHDWGAAAPVVGQRGHGRLRDRATCDARRRAPGSTRWPTSSATTSRSTGRWPTPSPICDGYHCSMLGPTWPNRLYLMTGQVDPAGAHGGPVYPQLRARPRATPGRPTRSC